MENVTDVWLYGATLVFGAAIFVALLVFGEKAVVQIRKIWIAVRQNSSDLIGYVDQPTDRILVGFEDLQRLITKQVIIDSEILAEILPKIIMGMIEAGDLAFELEDIDEETSDTDTAGADRV